SIIADGTVTGTDLASATVALANMANNSVNSNIIVDGSIVTADVNNINYSKLSNAASSYMNYMPNNVACANNEILAWDNTNARWSCAANASATAITSLTGDVTGTGPGAAATTIANNAVTSAKIADGTVTGTDLASATVALANMANNSVDATKIVDGSVTGTDL